MDSIVAYLQSCLQPKDTTEFHTCKYFDKNIFQNMKQDGIMITEHDYPFEIECCERVKIGNYYMYKKCIKPLHWLNHDGSFSWTHNPQEDPLYKRLVPPPDETVNHTLLIKSVIEQCNPSNKNYVEYGVRWATNISVIAPLVHKAYGVDIAYPPSIPPNCSFYQMMTNTFSTQMLSTLTFHFAFIDADHKFESCFDDFQHIYQHIQPGGYIFLHDTYPCEQRLLDPGACNDCYKTPLAIKRDYPDAEILTLPLNPGFTIVRKVN